MCRSTFQNFAAWRSAASLCTFAAGKGLTNKTITKMREKSCPLEPLPPPSSSTPLPKKKPKINMASVAPFVDLRGLHIQNSTQYFSRDSTTTKNTKEKTPLMNLTTRVATQIASVCEKVNRSEFCTQISDVKTSFKDQRHCILISHCSSHVVFIATHVCHKLSTNKNLISIIMMT